MSRYPAFEIYEHHDPTHDFMGKVSILGFIVFWVCLPWEWSWPIYMWLLSGAATNCFKLWNICANNPQLNWKEELWIALRTPDAGFFVDLLSWPISWIAFAFKRECTPYSVDFKMRVGNKIHRESNQRQYERWMNEKAHDQFQTEIMRAKIFRQHLDEAPETIEAGVRTAYACGMITTAVVGTTSSAKAQSKDTTLKLGMTGWVTVAGEISPAPGKETPDLLRHVRLRPTADFGKSFSFYGDIELVDFNTYRPNWLKEAWIQYSPSSAWSIRAGRLALTPIRLTPPPFMLETINFPRLPYHIFAYGIQGRYTTGKFTLLADVSGVSGLNFDAQNQFDGIETSGRMEYSATSALKFGGQIQLGGEFTAGGIDWNWKPAPWATLKGAAYLANAPEKETRGGYVYLGIEPCKEVEIYGQFDVQEVNRSTSTITSCGVTLKSPERRQAVTIGCENYRDNISSGTSVFFKAQVRF